MEDADGVFGGAGRAEPIRPDDTSLLEEFAKDMADETPLNEVAYEVRTRPGYSVVFSKEIPRPQLTSWQRVCADKNTPGGLNSFKLACIVLANQCRGIYRSGQPMPDGDGGTMSFSSRLFLEATGAAKATEAVSRFYRLDGLVESTANAVLSEAGYDSDVPPDPTLRP